MLTALDLKKEELEEYAKAHNKKWIKEFRDKVMKLNSNKKFVAELTKEEDALYYENTVKEYYSKKGLEEGIEQGMEEQKIKMAKNMLKAGESTDKIIAYTGISLKDLEKIK